MWCVVLVLVSGVWWWCCVLCGVLCWCCVVSGGVYFCVFLCFFSQFSSFSFLLSLFPSSLFFPLLSSLPLFLLSSLLTTKQCGKNRSTNTAANFEAFECDLAHGRCKAVGSPSPLSSPLPPPFSPSPPQKKRELFITGIIPARELFLLQF